MDWLRGRAGPGRDQFCRGPPRRRLRADEFRSASASAPRRRQGRRPLAEADGGRTERRGLGVAREERMGEGAGQRIGGRERHRSLARRQVDLRRTVGQAVVPASLARQDAGGATGDPAGLPRGQPSLGPRRQDAARSGSRHHAAPARRAAPAVVRRRKRLSSSASIRRR